MSARGSRGPRVSPAAAGRSRLGDGTAASRAFRAKQAATRVRAAVAALPGTLGDWPGREDPGGRRVFPKGRFHGKMNLKHCYRNTVRHASRPVQVARPPEPAAAADPSAVLTKAVVRAAILPRADAEGSRRDPRALRSVGVAHLRRQLPAPARSRARSGSSASCSSASSVRSTRSGAMARRPGPGSRARTSRFGPRPRDLLTRVEGLVVSSRTWTPPAVASEAVRYAGDAWRAVEAQHVVATMALVDTLDEQRCSRTSSTTGKPAGAPDAAPDLALPAVHAVPVSAAARRLALPRRDRSRRVLCGRRGPHRLRRTGLLALAPPGSTRPRSTRCRARADRVPRGAAARRRSISARRRSMPTGFAGPIAARLPRVPGVRARRSRGAASARCATSRCATRSTEVACAVLDPAAFAKPKPLDLQILDALGVARARRLAPLARRRRRCVRVRGVGVARAGETDEARCEARIRDRAGARASA